MKSLVGLGFSCSICWGSCTLVPSRSINHLRHSPTPAEGDHRRATIDSRTLELSQVTILSLCTQGDTRFWHHGKWSLRYDMFSPSDMTGQNSQRMNKWTHWLRHKWQSSPYSLLPVFCPSTNRNTSTTLTNERFCDFTCCQRPLTLLYTFQLSSIPE